MNSPDMIFKTALEAAKVAVDARAKELEGKPFAFDCGFAWVVLKPARGPQVTWCKDMIQKLGGDHIREASKYGDKHYGGGWCFWCPGSEDYRGQSISVFEAGANAFARVLRENGLDAKTGSRLD